MTPFEIANTKQFVMVNRGWLPMDSSKHRLMLAQYIGEGFTPFKLKGVIRREEYLWSWWKPAKENFAPLTADLSWFVLRPYNMANEYYVKRWGAAKVEDKRREHGVRHYFVEMMEDYEGNDQRLIRGHAWPKRRDEEEITYMHLPPNVHAGYVFFWFSVCLISLCGTRNCFLRQREVIRLQRKFAKEQLEAQTKRNIEAKAYQEQAEKVLQMQENLRRKR